MRWFELRLPPPIVAALAGALAWWLAGFGPQWRLAVPIATSLACLWLVAGLIVALLGLQRFRDAGTTINPHTPAQASALVTSGIYRYTRNPMYLGLALVLCGWAVWLAAPAALAGPLLFAAWITRFQIIPEERILTDKFGQEYLDWCQRVRRWV